MSDLYLSGYWGVSPAGCSAYGLDHCGGPYRWTVGRRPAPHTPGLLWAVPYAGRRFAYVFDAYEPGEGAPFFAHFRRAVPDGELVRAEPSVYVCQTDARLPGFEPNTGLWGSYDADDLGGCLYRIDTGPSRRA